MGEKQNKISRRDIVKGLATVPVAGALVYGWYRKLRYDNLFKEAIREDVSLDAINPVLNRNVSNDKQLRLGIIGTGGRGRALLKAAGFLNPEIIDAFSDFRIIYLCITANIPMMRKKISVRNTHYAKLFYIEVEF